MRLFIAFLAVLMLLAAPAAPAWAAPKQPTACVVCGQGYAPGSRYVFNEESGASWHPTHATPAFCANCGVVAAPYGPRGDAVHAYAGSPVNCRTCFASAVTTDARAAQLLRETRARMVRWGLAFPWGEIPVHLVTKGALNAGAAGRGADHGKIGMTYTTLMRSRGKATVHDLRIEVVVGLSKAHFQEVVAHELMHAWLSLAGRENLDPAFNEGACNLAAYYVLQELGGADADYRRLSMYRNEDPVYGDGLRRHVRLATERRFEGVIAALRKGTTFPPGY